MKLPGNFGLVHRAVPAGKTNGRKNDGGRNAPALFKEGKSPHLPAILLDAGQGRGESPPGQSVFSPEAGDLQVPISHEARYFFCSGVRRSILAPMAASFSLAISRSISSGIGQNF